VLSYTVVITPRVLHACAAIDASGCMIAKTTGSTLYHSTPVAIASICFDGVLRKGMVLRWNSASKWRGKRCAARMYDQGRSSPSHECIEESTHGSTRFMFRHGCGFARMVMNQGAESLDSKLNLENLARRWADLFMVATPSERVLESPDG